MGQKIIIFQKRIVGGNETRVHEFPMMAGLLEDGEDMVACGGVVIDKRYVLTAAHCFTLDLEEVVLGLHDQNTLDSKLNLIYMYVFLLSSF